MGPAGTAKWRREASADLALEAVKSSLATLREGGEHRPADLQAVQAEMGRVTASVAADYALATSNEEVATRNAVQADLRRLGAKKWLSEQADAVVSEWAKLRQIHALDEARRACNTSEVTMQKARLADRLVTSKVVQRFGEELRALKAGKLPVAFDKKRGQKGRVLHGTSVAGSETRAKPNDVLSEGERRVLALAAFLADTTTAENGAPFIFDDPISSLDHVFERAVAKCLALLARDRQVIVFTASRSRCSSRLLVRAWRSRWRRLG